MRAKARAQTQEVQKHVLRGPEPIGLATEESIDSAYGLSMAGAAGPMTRIGMPTPYGVGRFMGDCGPLQNFGKGRFAGASPTWTGSLNEAQLPGNPTKTSTANPVLRAMVTNGVGI